jgi:hypothetical protein
VAKDGEEMSFAWLAGGLGGTVTAAGGPYAGEHWPDGMLDWPPGRIGSVRCPIISPHVQIECKEMWTVWVPGSSRRAKDAEDVARLRRALQQRRREATARRTGSGSHRASYQGNPGRQ